MVSVLVEHEYTAAEDDELTMRPGDIINDVVKQEGGWWEGVLDGKKGVFPENFVKEMKSGKPAVLKTQTSVGGHVAAMTSRLGMAGGIKLDAPVKKRDNPTKKLGRAKVVFSYQPQNEDELALEVDSIIEVTSQVEEGWWEGTVNNKQGLFPSNFVKLIEEEPETEKIVQAKKVKGVGLGNIFSNAPITLRSQGVRPTVRKQNNSEKKDDPEIQNKKESPRDLPTSPRDIPAEPVIRANKETKEPKRVERARVLYSYNAENDDELSIELNDVIVILSKSLDDSGWWQGELGGKVGVFPDNFVELIPEEVTKPKKPPPPSVAAPKPKEVQDEKPIQSHKGKPLPPPVGKKPVKCSDPALLAQTDDDKANVGHVDLAKNGVVDKPVAQVTDQNRRHSSSTENPPDQLEKGKDMKSPDEAGEHDVPCPPSKGTCPTGEMKHGRRFARHDHPLQQTPSEGDSDIAPTEAPQGPKDGPKHSASGHPASRVPPPMPKEPPTQSTQKSPRSTKPITSPHEHSKAPCTEVTHAAPPAEVVTSVSPSLVAELQHEVEHLKATSVSIEKYDALQQEVRQLHDDFASLKKKMNVQITELMDEVDDEKKIRLTMQVEIERIRKLTKPT